MDIAPDRLRECLLNVERDILLPPEEASRQAAKVAKKALESAHED